jgi:hypothetical protein
METINLLDLNNDILNIIGDYVKQDNIKREYIVVHEIGKNSINLFKIIKKSQWNDNKPAMRLFIINYFYVNNIRDIEIIDIYLTLMKLNLKRKKYSFSEDCIDNLEDNKKWYDEVLEKKTVLFYKKPTNYVY